MRKRTYLQIILIVLGISLSTLSCNKIIFREVECRDLNNIDHLKWFAGSIGDTITFVKPDNTKIRFIIDDKYIYHRTNYISDTGCGCHDMWGIRMVSESDTISMYNQEKYVEDNESNDYSTFYIKVSNITSGFITEYKSLLNSLNIDNVQIFNLIRFEYEHNSEGQFKEIYIAENIGIVQMIDTDGGKWINENLSMPLDISFNSFLYEENTCE